MQGSLDLLVQRTGKDSVTFVQNNFFYDAFWLRAIGGYPTLYIREGAEAFDSSQWCLWRLVRRIEWLISCRSHHFVLGTLLTFTQPFGVSYSGATYKYTVLDTSGVRSAAQGPLYFHPRIAVCLLSETCSWATPSNWISLSRDALRLLWTRAYQQLHREPIRRLN